VTRRVEVVRTHLELTEPDQLAPFKLDDPLLRLARVPVCTVELSRRLYREVGEAYHWVDRYRWAEQEWREFVTQPGFGVWILSRDGDLAGFFELRTEEDGAVEISLFGLVPRFQGKGLGKHLLSCAVETAWAIGATRVWLHTCTLDHPHALPNYHARGFREFKRETYVAEI
jgi:GNAT superfamily N-acetyltransferase